MKKIILSLIMVLSCTISSFAQSHSDRLSLGVGALYERGLDATIAWEHEFMIDIWNHSSPHPTKNILLLPFPKFHYCVVHRSANYSTDCVVEDV